MLKFIVIFFGSLIFSLNAMSSGNGVCVTFADGHGQCISDVDENGETALNLKKQAADSFKKNAQDNYIDRAKESAIDMLIEATKKYKEGTLSKEKYIEAAMQVSQMADYAKKIIKRMRTLPL